jgi:DNA-directed RNA polymerase subunit RPC12/RpoP
MRTTKITEEGLGVAPAFLQKPAPPVEVIGTPPRRSTRNKPASTSEGTPATSSTNLPDLPSLPDDDVASVGSSVSTGTSEKRKTRSHEEDSQKKKKQRSNEDSDDEIPGTSTDTQETVQLRRSSRKEITYSCEYPDCNFTTKKTNDLRNHMQVVHEGEKFQCSDCGKSYTAKRSLKLHIDMKHHDKKRFECKELLENGEVCDFKTNDQGAFIGHLGKRHGKGSVKCSKCNKQFDNSRTLTRHNCTKKKEFECAEDGRKFFSQESLETHMETFHSDTPQYICSQCGAVLGSAQSLQRHENRQH